MLRPLGLALSAEGTLAISEEGNNRISRFTPAGEYRGELPVDAQDALLQRPGGLRFDAAGNLYIADTWNYRVQVLSPAGVSLLAWGEAGLFGLGRKSAARKWPVGAT